ncbi:MAG: glutaredoxin [gamma proteobacterium symbiont of Taylorina sp.]|nr:glutaredoxin [gamma proteobacterium symbiont of Taylorina sp.]
MSEVKIYSTATCPMCTRAKGLMEKWNINFVDVRVDMDRAGLIEMSKVTDGARTVPQITVNGKWIGSLAELTELHMDGELDHLMES